MLNMEIRTYRFGPVVFAFKTKIPICVIDKYEEFRSDNSIEPDFTVEIIPLSEDSPCGIKEPIQTEIFGNRITAAMNQSVIPYVTVGRLMYLIGAAHLFLQKDAFVLHASYIVRAGKALLFSAPSGTGKSTQANLWHNCRGCEIINGDRVIVSCENGQFYASGAYVAGSSGIYRNVTAPLGHIILIEQAKSCVVKNIPAVKKLQRLLCECSFDQHDLSQYNIMMELVSDLITKVPVFGYGCTKDPEAVEVLEKYL